MISASASMFCCAPRSVRTEMFFCIISWSSPVIAIAMKAPASSCLAQKPEAMGSWPQTRDSPVSASLAMAAAGVRSSAASSIATHSSRPASMPAVCSVSVQTMVLTPPSTV